MNRASYNKIAADWDRARHAFFGREEAYVDALIDGLPVPSAILDLGCGTGRPIAEYLIRRGHRVTGVDQASRLLDIARSRFPDATWIEAPIETFSAEQSFDAVICWDALFHIPREHHASMLRRMASVLTPGGRLMCTVGGMGGSDHPAFTDTMFGETFFYDSLAPLDVLALLPEIGFTPVIAEFMNAPDGARDKGRFAIVAART